ncbi:response regulator transcription factor [Nocardioides sp.]|uniref:response regulator transcription factor n=1 Tax=Nocardioides sp. TaxID=35761 RepID=UPI0037833FC7
MKAMTGMPLDQSLPWLTWELDGLGGCDWSVVGAAVVVLLRALVPADAIVWNGFDFATGECRVLGDPPEMFSVEIGQLTMELDDHPMMHAYLGGAAAATAAPLRISDLVDERTFRRTRTWADLFRPLGLKHQLTTPTGGDLRTVGVGWSLNRAHGDFTDAEVELMTMLQPVLAALEHTNRWEPVPAVDHSAGLTPRELQVLALVADGLTAQAIGHRLRISPGTVRKHLEHVYEKTGCRDRLLAVRFALDAGLIGDRPTHPPTHH